MSRPWDVSAALSDIPNSRNTTREREVNLVHQTTATRVQDAEHSGEVRRAMRCFFSPAKLIALEMCRS